MSGLVGLTSGLSSDAADSSQRETIVCRKKFSVGRKTVYELEMWANAQRDGRPAEHRWRPLFNAAVSLTTTTRVPCSNAAKTQSPLKLPGVPQTNERISAATEPKFTILWGPIEEILLLNKFFFGLSIHALVAKIWPDKVVGWCPDGDFWVLHLHRAACSTFQTCILDSH